MSSREVSILATDLAVLFKVIIRWPSIKDARRDLEVLVLSVESDSDTPTAHPSTGKSKTIAGAIGCGVVTLLCRAWACREVILTTRIHRLQELGWAESTMQQTVTGGDGQKTYAKRVHDATAAETSLMWDFATVQVLSITSPGSHVDGNGRTRWEPVAVS